MLVVGIATLVVTLPLVSALVALQGKHWFPVLDLAMTEVRVRDVFGRHTPLIGLPGRIGEYPNQGSHPGPLSFYLLAPTYRLLGSSSWALQVATVVIHAAAVATALTIGWRQRRAAGVVAAGLLLAVVIRGYGALVLTQPWNPYLPVLAWIVVLLGTWAVMRGDTAMVVPTVVAASLCAQTHVPYLVPAGALALLAIGVVLRRSRTMGGAAITVGVVLWSPPLIDQVRHDPGNISKLLDHFGSPPEAALGLVDGFRLALRHLDVGAGFVAQAIGSGRFLTATSAGRGLVMLMVWLVAAAVAGRRGSRPLRLLHAVVGLGFLLGVAAMARIFGKPWFYLTLWAWGVTAVMLGAIVWTVWTCGLRGRVFRLHRRWVAAVGVGVLALTTGASTVSFARVDVPESRLSDAVEALAEPTYDAVMAGVGVADGEAGSYQVRWSDAADIGSPGMGLFDALERRELDVWVDPFFQVPLTDHRARDRSAATAQIHLATGVYVELWRTVPDAVEVAAYDPRTNAQRLEAASIRQRLVDRLTSEGLADVVPLVDTNMFGAALDPRLSEADQDDFTVLLDLGQPMAVFIAPAMTDPVLPA